MSNKHNGFNKNFKDSIDYELEKLREQKIIKWVKNSFENTQCPSKKCSNKIITARKCHSCQKYENLWEREAFIRIKDRCYDIEMGICTTEEASKQDEIEGFNEDVKQASQLLTNKELDIYKEQDRLYQKSLTAELNKEEEKIMCGE